MTDFEQALRFSLSFTFPGALIDGCHLHFCQAILRNAYKLGYKTDYEAVITDTSIGYKQGSILHTLVRQLMMLAMVPTNDVPEAFNAIADNQADRVETDLNRTNNYCNFSTRPLLMLLVTPTLRPSTFSLLSSSSKHPRRSRSPATDRCVSLPVPRGKRYR